MRALSFPPFAPPYLYAGFPYTFALALQCGQNLLSNLTMAYRNPRPFFRARVQTGHLSLQKSALF